MYPRIGPRSFARRVRDAESLPVADDSVSYPAWYARRWHYLPDGYLSRGSVRLYESLIARLYNASLEGRVLRHVAARVRALAPAAATDLGCGPGHLLSVLGNTLPGVDVTGFDLSPFMVERAQAAAGLASGRAVAVHADARSLPLADESAPVLVATHLLGHIPDAAATEVFDEAARVLAPGGRFLVLDHSWHRLPEPGPLAVRVRERLLGGILTLTTYAHPEPVAAVRLPA
ncbi:MAG: class I SAM-dependent methyltransferase [Chloroflexi bacterium]|nr:class I SAM-dependent methyltransferase [Chloroflexota bacterium]